MNDNAHIYELLAADFSPVALLVLSSDGHVIRHVNHTMALLLGPGGALSGGRKLAELAPGVDEVLQPLVQAVATRVRPRRQPGLSLPFPESADRERTWDVACAPLPPDISFAPPELVALWLWPEDMGTASSRQVAEVLREGLQGALPPAVPGFEMAAVLVPSEPGAALGGDTYDAVPLPDGRWALLMADVSGRGPVAAARAVMVRHSARVLIALHGPAETLSYLSRLLIGDPSFAGFVTAFLGVLDPAAGTLTYCVAGHDPALLVRGGTGVVEELLGEGALPLAVDENADYTDHVIPFSTRDLLLLHTDGLTDTRRDEEFFDQERVRTCLLDHRALPAAALVATLLAEAEDWAGPGTLRDDTAVLAVRGQDAGKD